MNLITLLSSLLICLASTQAENILMITMCGTKSHKIPFMALANGLISRGHHITFLSGFKPEVQHNGLEEVTPTPFVNYIQNYMDWDLVGARYEGKSPIPVWRALRYPAEACDSLLSDSATIDTLMAKKFDLAILDGAFPECALGLVHRLAMPFMYINTVGLYTGSLAMAGNPNVYAITPHVLTALTQSMDFFQRFQNAITHILAELLHKYCVSQVHAVLQTHLGRHVPHPYTMAHNVSFILQNGHASITYPRPFYPHVAEIACIHCRPAGTLPRELEDFMSSARTGVIYYSMGSSVRTAKMPDDFYKTMVSVFAQLSEYHVLWKWEGNATQLAGLTPNVRLSAWLPQQDILGHRRLKAFITHGGLLSMYEAIYHAMPMVMLPVFCDHDVNVAKATADGYAVHVPLDAHLTKAQMLHAILKVIHNGKYRRAIRAKRALFLDQPAPPLETAIFWTEYTLRHKGATHLLAPDRNLGFVAYHSLDVISACFVGILLLLLLLHAGLKYLRRMLLRGKAKRD
ncbi:UDP-glucuronosyltransferase 2A1-like [Anastrepha obliqua]|uniref:UDP-glucuronosyltransferase 2A1-like n=1 Tax=Anastrepha obliqua TaxID=95512 RepID=UPI00240A3E79|nr:UDP-glucuronosyltransferase 2A1-like [Anastrepha obliqua]